MKSKSAVLVGKVGWGIVEGEAGRLPPYGNRQERIKGPGPGAKDIALHIHIELSADLGTSGGGK